MKCLSNHSPDKVCDGCEPPLPPTHRIEWTGNIKVYQPIRPTVHQAATEAAVMCS